MSLYSRNYIHISEYILNDIVGLLQNDTYTQEEFVN